MNVQIGEKIRAFVENGGQFLATYFTGYVDTDLLAYLGGNSLVGRIILAVDPEFLNVNDSAIALMASMKYFLR